NVLSLEKQKVAYQERISALNSVSNNVSEAGTRGMMALQIAGLDEPNFTGELSNLRQLEERKKEMLLLYQPSAREVEELNNKIEESKSRIQSAIDFRRRKIDQELSTINKKLSEYDAAAYQLPEKEKKFLDAARGYTINDELYSSLLSKYSQAELSIKSNVSDITIIDLAKFQNQGPISPDKRSNLLTAVMFAVILPTLFLFLKEILDTKLKGIPDIRKRTTIPFIGTIGNNIHPDDQLVVLGRPKSSISESFR